MKKLHLNLIQVYSINLLLNFMLSITNLFTILKPQIVQFSYITLFIISIFIEILIIRKFFTSSGRKHLYVSILLIISGNLSMIQEKFLNKSLISSILTTGFMGLGYIQSTFVLFSTILSLHQHSFKQAFALYCSCALLGIYAGQVVQSYMKESYFWIFEVVFITLSLITYSVKNNLQDSGNKVIQKVFIGSYMENRVVFR